MLRSSTAALVRRLPWGPRGAHGDLGAIATANAARGLVPITSRTSHTPVTPRLPLVQQRRWYQPDRLYEGQDAARHMERRFSELSGKIPWEPDPRVLEGLPRSWLSPEPNLNELIREDLPAARQLFRRVLQQQYATDMGMWNKWGCMEWKAGNLDLARMIFAKAAKVSFHTELWQSWASLELEARQYLEARRLFKVILATDPRNAKAGLGLALVEVEVGQQRRARERFAALAAEHPGDPQVLQAYGVFEARYHNLPLARELFAAAAELPHATAQVWHAWAKAEFDCGLFKNAQAVLQRGMRQFPTHKWLVQLAAMTHYKLGDTREARRAFQRLVAGGLYVEPSSYNAYAKMEEELGYDEVAVALYTEALRGHPEHVPSAMALALLHHRLGNTERVRWVFEHCLERLQETHHPVQHTAEMMHAWGTFEETHARELAHAKELYEEVTRQLPTFVDGWRALARVEGRLGNLEAARAVLNRAAQYIPTDAPLLVELAKIEQRHRRFPAARRAYERALKLDPSRAAVWNMRAVMELGLDPARARTIVENALTVIPKDEKKSWSILLCTYGRALAALEDYDKAVVAFQRSFRLAPKNWETHVIYAESVLAPNAAWAEAQKHLVAARRLLPRGDRRRRAVEDKLRVVERRLAVESTSPDNDAGEGGDGSNKQGHDDTDAEDDDEEEEEDKRTSESDDERRLLELEHDDEEPARLHALQHAS